MSACESVLTLEWVGCELWEEGREHRDMDLERGADIDGVQEA